MSFESQLFWNKLDWKGRLIYVSLGAVVVVVALALFRFMPTGAEAKLSLRAACASVAAPMSPATLYDHFPSRTYTPRCLPGTEGCVEFTTRAGETRHYLCAEGQCVMHWRSDGWGCRVPLSEGGLRAQGPGALQNTSGTWNSLAD